MKVLLVDDEIEFVSALAERLTLRGIEADWTGSPEDAVRRIREQQYDVAVLDIKMPRTSGLELKKLIEAKCPLMKFIFLTGHGSEEAFQAGTQETGCEYYLVKPVRFEKLLEKIRSVTEEPRGGKDDE